MSTPLPHWRKWIVALIAVVATATAGCAYLETKERELVYRPVRIDARVPSDLGLAFDDVWLDVAREDGAGRERIHGWWLPARAAGAPALLYLHGVRWSLGNNLFRIARLHEMGFAVLAIDYRGFGASDGELPSEPQVYADARAAWAELARRDPRADQRFIYGHSLGAAVALELGATETGAAGIIADSGFTSLRDAVAANNLPVSFLVTQRYDALTRVGELRAPVLFVHGTDDRFVPPAMSEQMYAAARVPKRLLLIPGATHSNYAGVGLDEYRRAIEDFVVLARQAAPGQAQAPGGTTRVAAAVRVPAARTPAIGAAALATP